MNIQNTNCSTCTSSKTYLKTNAKCTINGCSTDWIDSTMLRMKFGPDYCDGMRRMRWFPSWLIEFCPDETKPGDLGYPDPCEKNVYYQLTGGIVYRVEFDCNLKEIKREALKKYLIQDCAIESLSASKIINRCDFFKNTTLVNDINSPAKGYTTKDSGFRQLSPNIQLQDLVLTEDCELKAVYDNRLARRAVLPFLKCLVDYDIVTDVAKINLANVIDNKTIRIKQVTGTGCDILFSYTYAQDNIEGDGTDTSPLIAKVKVQDNIEGDGTSANRLIAKVKVDGITVTGNGTNINPLKAKTYVDPNQFNGDGQSPASQYSIKPCTIPNTFFTTYAKAVRFDKPLASNRIIQIELSKRIISTITWNLSDLPTPCSGKKLFGQLTVRVKSAINVPSFPVHLFGSVQVSNGGWVLSDAVQPLPQMQVSSGTTAEYGDSRGYTADITYFVMLDGGSTTFTLEPFAAFPNNIDPATTRPTNPLYPSGIPNDVWFESISAQLVITGVI